MKPKRDNKGLLLVISGPSGSGKSTLISKLIESNDNIYFSISATTRPPRDGERDGTDYCFLSQEKFRELVSAEKMLEWAQYCGNFYGTPRDNILQKLEEGKHVLLEIEVQGAMQIRKRMPEAVLIFLMPPSYKTLYDRLTNRNTETRATVESRLHAAIDEISKSESYDYVVLSDTIESTLSQLGAIIEAELLKSHRSKNFIQEVINDALSFHQ